MRQRLEGLGAVLMLLGLVAWYAGGSDAIDRLLRVRPVTIGSAVLAAVALALGLWAGRGGGARSSAAGLLLAGGVALVVWTAVPLVNALADRSAPHPQASRVEAFRKPAKGPRLVRVTWQGRGVETRASRAAGCAAGQAATLHVRRGALGLPWLESIDCAAPGR